MGEAKKKSEPVLPWMRSPIDVSLFEECPLALLHCLDNRLKVALQDMGFSSLFQVQVAVWQETIGSGGFERDLCVNSPTGSGKTLAYGLPIVQMLSTRTVKSLRALVVLPTRDLALQGLQKDQKWLWKSFESQKKTLEATWTVTRHAWVVLWVVHLCTRHLSVTRPA